MNEQHVSGAHEMLGVRVDPHGQFNKHVDGYGKNHHFLGMHLVLLKYEYCVQCLKLCSHDLDHPGLNNNFQIAARTKLAILHNDASVLENHHCTTGFLILSRPVCH